MRAQDLALVERRVEVGVGDIAEALPDRPLGRRIVLGLDGAKPADCFSWRSERLADQVVDPQPASDEVAQSRPFVVAMSASLPAASASVHHCGANSSRTIRPPAASAAPMPASPSPYATKLPTRTAP